MVRYFFRRLQLDMENRIAVAAMQLYLTFWKKYVLLPSMVSLTQESTGMQDFLELMEAKIDNPEGQVIGRKLILDKGESYLAGLNSDAEEIVLIRDGYFKEIQISEDDELTSRVCGPGESVLLLPELFAELRPLTIEHKLLVFRREYLESQHPAELTRLLWEELKYTKLISSPSITMAKNVDIKFLEYMGLLLNR
jgi:hypothetical protein